VKSGGLSLAATHCLCMGPAGGEPVASVLHQPVSGRPGGVWLEDRIPALVRDPLARAGCLRARRSRAHVASGRSSRVGLEDFIQLLDGTREREAVASVLGRPGLSWYLQDQACVAKRSSLAGRLRSVIETERESNGIETGLVA
jgi:hypothetical protein